jgi:hypothetical protein
MKLGVLALVPLCALLCCDLETTTKPRTFVIRGKVTTGAHAPTPVAGAYVGMLGPQGANGGHWIRYGSSSDIPNTVVTNADGTYSFTIDLHLFESEIPFFIAVSDSDQTFTMLSVIPADLGVENAELTIDINPATTTASQLVCPGGKAPPPANTWCYSAPSKANTELITILETALDGDLSKLETGAPPQWGTFAGGFLNDPATFTEIKNNLTGQGITVGAPATIIPEIAALPLVKPPTARTNPGTGSSSGGGNCQLVWDCKASSQCAQVYGAKTGSAAEPDAATCASICKSQGACTCQGC